MKFITSVKNVVKLIYPEKDMGKIYNKKFQKYAFSNIKCKNKQQYEALITKLYHAIEKGLSYEDYRAGFGKNNVDQLMNLLEEYSKEYSVTEFFYETALSTLNEYVKKNKEYGHNDQTLESRINTLKGNANNDGGVLKFEPYKKGDKIFDFSEFVKTRHSIRHFSKEPISVETVKRAVALAQHTPSACNRQGWKTRIITNSEIINTVLENQNGNRGFGQEIKTLLVVTGDLRYFAKPRETNQVFIDGGMYAMNLLHCLHHEEIASIPLSASLRERQELNVRRVVGIDDEEVLIMFIGIGNYPNNCITTKSSRKPAEIIICE